MPKQYANLSTLERIDKRLEESVPNVTKHLVTFTAAGDGAIGALDIFTVTGGVEILTIAAFCSVSLTETGGTVQIQLGTAQDTNQYIATTEPVDIDAGEPWTAVDPLAFTIAIIAAQKDTITSEDVILTIANDTISAGVLEFYARWVAVSADGDLVAS